MTSSSAPRCSSGQDLTTSSFSVLSVFFLHFACCAGAIGFGEVRQKQIDALVGQGHRRRICVAADDHRHDRCVDHAKTFDAFDAKLGIDDGVVVPSYASGADGVPHGRNDALYQSLELGIALSRQAWEMLRFEHRFERVHLHDPAHHSD
jgi:hypothetical protein